MKKLFIILFICSIFGCPKQEKLALNQRIEKFQVSECKTDCGIDLIGVRTSKNKNDGLNITLGYIVNCSWKNGYLKNITEQNDTLIVELDRPHSDSGDYPMTSCHCFFYFDFVIRDYSKTPKVIRVAELFEKNKYWDERDFDRYEIEEVEEIIIDKK
ncbi:hypothetical protein [Aquimarina sp. AU58]|uniref:hypothetical protein n=1 Tax=Aquimarina sp. AU58 TaxID=1874112 RepID=UPI000D6DE5CC|nr:hypothetical protein [Aquimarina sp. AU58]